MSLVVNTCCNQACIAVEYVIVQRNGLTLLGFGLRYDFGIGIHEWRLCQNLHTGNCLQWSISRNGDSARNRRIPVLIGIYFAKDILCILTNRFLMRFLKIEPLTTDEHRHSN